MSFLLARLIGRTRLSWYTFTAIVGLTLTLLALGTAYLDGALAEFFVTDLWRNMLAYPALIAYILAILPPLDESEDTAVEALRPLVAVDDASFAQMFDSASKVTPRGELIAFAIGVAIGISGVAPWEFAGEWSWMAMFWLLAVPLEMGLLAWSIYVAFAGTKPMTVLHRHLEGVDVLDLSPFEPIARHSLVASLAFIGGAAVHLFFQVGGEHVFEPGNLIMYGILASMSAFIFFLTMGPTHRVLSAAKDQELQRVQNNIAAAYRSLEHISAGSPEIGAISAKLSLWQAYEGRLKGARSWPYNFGMLRTFVLSVFTPVAINLVQRLIGEWLS
jgi:hypothetical protein